MMDKATSDHDKSSTSNKNNTNKVPKKIMNYKRGNFPGKSNKQKKTKLLQKNVNNELETLLHADKGESPLVLVELSNNEWNKMKPNSIHLQNASIVKPDKKSVLHQKVYYSNYNLGTNITKNQQNITPTLINMKDEGTSLNASIINVLRIKNSMVAIVTDTDELFQVFNNIVLMTSSRTPILPSNTFFHGSGKVLLFMYKHVNTKDGNKSKRNDMLFDKIKTTKPNICLESATNNHFRSQGYIAAWGNKAMYATTPSSSTVGQYVTRSPKKEANKQKVHTNNEELENLISSEITIATSKFEKWLPNFSQIIAPIIKAAYEKQSVVGDINLKEQNITDSGLWQSEICIDAITRDFHTEKDVTYTLISVPDQVHDGKNKKQPEVPIFLFQINDDTIFGFKLHKKSTFVFNGTMLTHRQYNENGYIDKKERDNINHFYNIACYGNQRLYNHMRKSFRRSLGIE